MELWGVLSLAQMTGTGAAAKRNVISIAGFHLPHFDKFRMNNYSASKRRSAGKSVARWDEIAESHARRFVEFQFFCKKLPGPARIINGSNSYRVCFEISIHPLCQSN